MAPAGLQFLLKTPIHAKELNLSLLTSSGINLPKLDLITTAKIRGAANETLLISDIGSKWSSHHGGLLGKLAGTLASLQQLIQRQCRSGWKLMGRRASPLSGRHCGDRETGRISRDGHVCKCEPVCRCSGSAQPHECLSHPYTLLQATFTH